MKFLHVNHVDAETDQTGQDSYRLVLRLPKKTHEGVIQAGDKQRQQEVLMDEH